MYDRVEISREITKILVKSKFIFLHNVTYTTLRYIEQSLESTHTTELYVSLLKRIYEFIGSDLQCSAESGRKRIFNDFDAITKSIRVRMTNRPFNGHNASSREPDTSAHFELYRAALCGTRSRLFSA